MIVNGKSIEINKEQLLICSGVDVSTLPNEVEVLVEGAHYFKRLPSGEEVEFTISANDVRSAVEQMTERMQRHPDRDTVVDFEHQTLTGEYAPAAAWSSGLKLAARDGLAVALATIKEWTDKGREAVEKKYYRYASPVFGLNAKDKETGKTWPCIYKHLALTNEPLIDDLMPIVAKNISQTIQGKGTSMDELIERLRYFLNLPTAATAQDCLTELNKLMTQLKDALAAQTDVAAKDVLAFLGNIKSEIAAKADLVKTIVGKDNGTIEEAKVVFIAAKDNGVVNANLQTELAALKKEKADGQFQLIIAKNVQSGKILPTQKDDADYLKAQRAFYDSDIVAFDKFWEKAPVIGPVHPVVLPGSPDIAAKNITDEDIEMGKTLGVTKEQLVKHNPAQKPR
jgi:phage I-like protein